MTHVRRNKFTPAVGPGENPDADASRVVPPDGTGRTGSLYVVATPLGNLRDITLRALDVLREVHLIAAEDTRHTRPLLAHYGIQTPLLPLHAHNEAAQIPKVLARLRAGGSVALVSDAGTPLVSDPGAGLVRAVRSAGLPVCVVPGPCAAVAALSVAGLDTAAFVFLGFLPARRVARRTALEPLLRESRTVVLYEAPHRIVGLLADLQAILGAERQITLAKELTKVHETVIGGTPAELLAWLDADAARSRGEFVVLIAGAAVASAPEDDLDNALTRLLTVLPARAAASAAVALTGAARNRAYARAQVLSRARGAPCVPDAAPPD